MSFNEMLMKDIYHPEWKESHVIGEEMLASFLIAAQVACQSLRRSTRIARMAV
jgi:hypothetical protein